MGGTLLYKGERQARRHHVCDICGRDIERSEFYQVVVVLIIHTDEREIHCTKRCKVCA
jgi:hypothetical protein